VRPATLVAFLALVAVSACGSDPPADPAPQVRHPHAVVAGDRPIAPTAPHRVAPPRRIRIPAIGVSAPIVPLGLNKDHTIEVPQHFTDTGWYRPGPDPGEQGPAVIVGHVDSKTGPAAFYRLRELKRGDQVLIRRADRSTVRFRVSGLERWPKAKFPTRRVYARTRGPVLRLVTCSGAFDSSSGHYEDNTIVFASRL
jgi:LPXTG-site transpeptidase (sortase) family protein